MDTRKQKPDTTFRVRKLSKNRLKNCLPIAEGDGKDLPVSFGNLYECEMCKQLMNTEKDFRIHNQGKIWPKFKS